MAGDCVLYDCSVANDGSGALFDSQYWQATDKFQSPLFVCFDDRGGTECDTGGGCTAFFFINEQSIISRGQITQKTGDFETA